MRPWVGLSLMMEAEFLAAALPLFDEGGVEVLEWSFDTGWPPASIPAWTNDLIEHFSAAGRLLGHGVSYSPLSAGDELRQDAWLAQFQVEIATHRYHHISEHYGFASAGNFHQSAPLPVPYCDAALALGRERLGRLKAIANMPAGLENLAFAFSVEDVRQQGKFLDQLLAPVDGFLVLDLHNLYCQVQNFGIPFLDLLALYPCERARELHVSGGSWSESSVPGAGPLRRDTHDDAVPEEVFAMLQPALDACPQVQAVILERLGYTLTQENAEAFRRDYRHLLDLVHG